jgi:zinc transport system substrate-binding protein
MRTLDGGLVGAVSLLALMGGAGAPVAAAEIDVVASIKPVHSLVVGVMQGVGEPVLLVKGTGSEHSYSLRPSEARALEQAEVVLWVGETMETFLIKPLRALAGDARVIELREVPGLTLLATREGGMWEAHQDDADDAGADADHDADAHAEEHDDTRERAAVHEPEGEPAGAEHEGADDGHGERDMHIWLNPGNAKVLAAFIASALGDEDPDNASAYQTNAARLRQQLDELDRSLADRLATVSDRPYVVFHDAYQYFERRYGVRAVGAITINPTVRPSAQRLGEIHERLEQLDAACVFAEPQFEPTLVATVIEGTSAHRGVLDPLGAALDPGPDQYFELLNSLADSLVNCLGTAKSG